MDFSVFQLYWLPTLVAGVAYFVIGAVWYGAFATPWMAGIGKSKDDLQSNPVDYVVSLICELLIAYGISVALRVFGTTGVLDAIFVATVVWFAFSLLPTIVHYAYEDRTFSLLAINKGYDFAGMVVAAVILQVWI
jgi:amino acid transporter